jgi:tetratricopeptide (TPR) repeat protein
MNQASQALSVVVIAAGSLLSTFAQTPQPRPLQNSPKTAASIEQIEDQIKKHPGDPRLYVGLGLAYWQRHDFPHALEAFQHAVKFGPQSAEAHNWLGVALLEKGDFTGSIAEFRRAIALDPKYARAYANLGSALNKNGQLAEAVKIFEDAVALEPTSPVAHMNLGIALREKGDAKGSIRHLRFVVEHEPDDANARFTLGQVLQQGGNQTAAIEEFENAVRLDPEFREAYYALGSALKQQAASLPKPWPPSPGPATDLYKRAEQAAAQDNLDDAKGLLEEALSKDGSNAYAHNLLGFILGQRGDLMSALVHLEKATELRPDLADTHYNLGVALWYSGSQTRAVSALRESVRLDPSSASAAAFLGVALRETGDLSDARKYVQHAIALQPSFAASYVDLGLTYLRAGDLDRALGQFETGLNFSSGAGPAPDWDNAIASLRKALASKADNAEAHNLLGLMLGHTGADSAKVLEELRAALRLRPDFAEAHNNVGLVLAQNNDGEGAIKEFREALRIQPDYVDAMTNLGAILVSTSTDAAEAVRVLERSLALAPTSLKAQFNLAEAYGADPNFGPAKQIEQLRKVIATDPNYPGVHRALGKALLRKGNVEDSVAELQTAVRLEPQSTEAHYQLGLSLARAGRKDEGEAEIQKSRQLASSDDRKQTSDLDITEGRAALDKGNLDLAAEKFRHALVLQPQSPDAQHLLATVLEKESDLAGALSAYRKTVELNPGDVFARERIIALSGEDGSVDDPARTSELNSYFRDGKFEEVEPLLIAYVKEHPKSSWGWYALGYSRFAQKKIGESIEALAKSLQLDIHNAEAHKILGRDLMAIGKFEAARLEFEQGIRYAPQSAEMHFDLGKLFAIQDDWTLAEKEFATALRLNPSYLEGLDALGFAQEALAKDDEAIASYQKAISLNEAQNSHFVSSHVNLSAHYNRKGDPAKALEYAYAALKIDPKSDGAFFQEGKAYEDMGRFNDAESAIRQAIALNPRMSSYYYVLANIDKHLGKTDEREKALASFKRLEEESNKIEEMRRSLANRSPDHPQPNSERE